MEYEKPPTATSFSSRTTTFSSKKMRNRSHSLNYGTNAAYDGVFASPASRKSSPLVDYSEIFQGSSPSPSSIPFLDIPEINGGKVKVDVRSSKLDYTSVFGGFGVCDFAVTPKEVIIKSERKTAIDDDKRNRRKAVNSSDVPLYNNPKTQSSSPEGVNMKHFDISYRQTGPHNENVTTHLNQVLTMPVLTQLVDNTTPSPKMESKTPVPSVKKEPYIVGLEEVKASRKQSSKTEVEFQNLFGDNFTSKTDYNGERPYVKPPSGLQCTLNGDKEVSERYLGLKPGVSERSQLEDDDSPSSPSYFDAETDVDSTAAESSAALKKAIEEAKVRMNIAKQMMERKKSGLLNHAKLKSCDDPKVENKEDQKVEGITEESRDSKTQVLDELVNSSEQSFSNEGDQLVKRARKQWKVPEELLKSNSDNKHEEEEPEVVKIDDEQEKRARKHWELPGGLFKSIINSKPQETENLAPAINETDPKQEVQPLTENPFYTFGQLGSKIKCVVEAFTGSKVSQKHETQVTECSLEDSQENSILNQVVQDEKSVSSQEMLADIPVMETYVSKVEETSQQIESKDKTKIDEDFESRTCTSTEGCSEKETEWQVINACEGEDGPTCVIEDSHENPTTTYDSLDQEGEKEIVSEQQEIFVDPDVSETNERRVEDIEMETANQSSNITHLDGNAGSLVSFVAENSSDPGNISNEKEQEHKAPRRRRVWKTSEDVYNMIKVPKGRKSWQLDSVEKETTVKCFLEEGIKINDAIEDKESTSELANDSGLQENWNNLKQMFRQMFQTVETKDETQCLLESGQEHVDLHKKAGDENEQEIAETSYSHMTGTDRYEHDEVEKVSMEYNAYTHGKDDEDLEPTREDVLVCEPIGEELEGIAMAGDEEGEDVHEAFEEVEFSEVEEIKENSESRGEMLEYDRSETDSNISGDKFEQMHEELVEEIRFDGSIDTDTSRSSFETRQGDSYIEEVSLERELCDQSPERTSASQVSSMEHIEETDSDSIQSSWGVVGDDDKLKSFVEESLPGQTLDEGVGQQPCKPKEGEETKEESSDEAKIEEHQFERLEEEEMIRSNVEAAESSCCLPKGDEKVDVALAKDMKDKDGENCRSSIDEDTISEASQNETERVDERLKKKDEAKEKERERLMVERAIREARERAFADARERAGKAAMEKAKAGARRKANSEVPRRSEKGSVDVNDKLSSAEKASMQAKLRAERAAVERALAEARERAMEKALSGKAASQAKVQSSKSFGSSGERRGSSSSNPENRSSGHHSSSNHTAKSEPVQRSKARSERHQRTSERAAEALAEKKLRDLNVQKEQAERNRVAETLDAEVKRWSSGKESNLRALLSTLQYILGAESGWKPIPLTDLVSSTAVRKAYRKATLYVHPDKLQQRGASTQQKYICEKVFDLLKEAWNKFGADER